LPSKEEAKRDGSIFLDKEYDFLHYIQKLRNTG
jgi:hypothetical protein